MAVSVAGQPQLEELLRSRAPVARLLRELAADGGERRGGAVLLSYVVAAAAAPAEESLLSLLAELEVAHCGTAALAVCPMSCLAAAATAELSWLSPAAFPPDGASVLRLGNFRRKLELRVCRSMGLYRTGGGGRLPVHLLALLHSDEMDCEAGGPCPTHCQYHRRVVRNAALGDVARCICAGHEGWEKLQLPPEAGRGKRTLAKLLGYCGSVSHRRTAAANANAANAGSAHKISDSVAAPSSCKGFRQLSKGSVALLGMYMRSGAEAVMEVAQLPGYRTGELLHGFVSGVAAEARKHQLGHLHLRDEPFQWSDAMSHVLTCPAGVLAVVRCTGDTTNATEHNAKVAADMLEREGMALPAAALWLLLAATTSASVAGSIQWLAVVAAIASHVDGDGHCDLGWGLISEVMNYWDGARLDAIDPESSHSTKRQRNGNGAAGHLRPFSSAEKCFCSALRCAVWATSLGVRQSATVELGDIDINMCSSLLIAFDGVSKHAMLGAGAGAGHTVVCALEILQLVHAAAASKRITFVDAIFDHHCAVVSNGSVGPRLPFDLWAQLAGFLFAHFVDHSKQIQTTLDLKIQWNVYACLAARLVQEGPNAVAQCNFGKHTIMVAAGAAAAGLVRRTRPFNLSMGLHDHHAVLSEILSSMEKLLALCVDASRHAVDAVLTAALAGLAEINTLPAPVAQTLVPQPAEGLEQTLAHRTLLTTVAILRRNIQPNSAFQSRCSLTALRVLRAFLAAAETASTTTQTIQRQLAQAFVTKSSDDTISVFVRCAFLECEQLHLRLTTEALLCLRQVASVHSVLAGKIMAQDNQLLPRAIKWTARAVRAERTPETLEAIAALCCLLVLLCQCAEHQFWHQAQRYSRHFADMVATVLQVAVKQGHGDAADSFVRPGTTAVVAVLRFVGEVADCCFFSRELERANISDALDSLVDDSLRAEYLGLTEHQAGRLCQMSRAMRNTI